MKHKKFITFRLFFLLILFPFFARAQYDFKVSKANGKPQAISPAGGMYYTLPKTFFKVRVIMEKITEVPGPFAKYAYQLLGTEHFIKNKKTYYKLLSVKVEPVTEADPSAVYYIQFPQDRSSKEIRSFGLRLDGQGIITGFGLLQKNKVLTVTNPVASASQVYLFSDNRKGFDMQAGYSRAQKVDTIIRKITIDTVTVKRFIFKPAWVNLSEKDRANDAAKQIKNIRQSRFNLLTGYQEVNYGNGIRYMDEELQKLEHEYLALFLGREYRQTQIQTFVFDPENQTLSKMLFQYTDKEGNTHALKVTAKVSNPMKLVPPAKTTEPNTLFYRIPVKAIISVGSGTMPFYSDTFTVPQLGIITTVPIQEKTNLIFDPHTGSILMMEKNEKAK